VAPAEIVEAGARFVGLNKDAREFGSVVAGLTAEGLRVLAWTVDMQCDADLVMAAGCDGVFSNEPLYAVRDYAAYRTHRSPWGADGTFGSGMLVYPGVGPLVTDPSLTGGRGGFVGAPGAWRWTLGNTPCLAGPVCPVAEAAGSYTVAVQLVFEASSAADPTGMAGLYLAVETDECPDDDDPATGYLVALRRTGALEVSGRPGDGGRMVAMGTTATSPIVTPVLSAALAAGSALVSVPVQPLPGALRPGSEFVLPTGQVAVLSAAAPREATSLPVTELVPSSAVPAGTALLQQVTIAVAKTPTGFTVRRSDDGAEAGYDDATWSGGYLFLRGSRDDVAAVSCSSLTVSDPEGGRSWAATS
jgi:hypothetical protein